MTCSFNTSSKGLPIVQTTLSTMKPQALIFIYFQVMLFIFMITSVVSFSRQLFLTNFQNVKMKKHHSILSESFFKLHDFPWPLITLLNSLQTPNQKCQFTCLETCCHFRCLYPCLFSLRIGPKFSY